MSELESNIKFEIKAYLEYRGGFWSDVSGGAYSKPGDPDIVACYRGRYIGIEGKTDEGREAPEQVTRASQIEAAGGIRVLACSVYDVRDVLNDIDKEIERCQVKPVR